MTKLSVTSVVNTCIEFAWNRKAAIKSRSHCMYHRGHKEHGVEIESRKKAVNFFTMEYGSND